MVLYKQLTKIPISIRCISDEQMNTPKICNTKIQTKRSVLQKKSAFLKKIYYDTSTLLETDSSSTNHSLIVTPPELWKCMRDLCDVIYKLEKQIEILHNDENQPDEETKFDLDNKQKGTKK
jgi:hypothetical protein